MSLVEFLDGLFSGTFPLTLLPWVTQPGTLVGIALGISGPNEPLQRNKLTVNREVSRLHSKPEASRSLRRLVFCLNTVRGSKWTVLPLLPFPVFMLS